MKVKKCIVVTSFTEDQPGFLDFSYRINSLAKHYDLTIISQRELRQSEMMVDAVSFIVLNPVYNKISWLSYLYNAAKLIRKLDPDLVVLLHSNLAPISFLIKKIPNCLYWNEHPTNLMHLPSKLSFVRYVITKIFHKIFFWGGRCADLVMPIGEEHRDELLRNGCEESKVKMIYMGVASEFHEISYRQSIDSDNLVIIYTGTVSKARGRDVLLGAMRIIAQKHLPVKLIIVGANSEELNYCQLFVEAYGLHNYLSIIGRVPGYEIPTLLSEADMGVCLWEDRVCWRFNPPTKLFEYLVAGLPVLASDIRTHTRYIRDGVNGFIFEYTSESLANVLEKCYQNRVQLDTLKMQAKSTAKFYLWENVEPIFLNAVKGVEKNEMAN